MEADDKRAPPATVNAAVDAVLVYATFPTAAAAELVAEAVVTQGLAACANILPGLTSIYIWEGRLEREQEVAMVMKTRRALAVGVVAETCRLHPFTNPAVLVLPVDGGSARFLAWIETQTAAAAGAGGIIR